MCPAWHIQLLDYKYRGDRKMIRWILRVGQAGSFKPAKDRALTAKHCPCSELFASPDVVQHVRVTGHRQCGTRARNLRETALCQKRVQVRSRAECGVEVAAGHNAPGLARARTPQRRGKLCFALCFARIPGTGLQVHIDDADLAAIWKHQTGEKHAASVVDPRDHKPIPLEEGCVHNGEVLTVLHHRVETMRRQRLTELAQRAATVYLLEAHDIASRKASKPRLQGWQAHCFPI
mmetsp:Transcript_81593/g.226002  ORF Transcript_81593/g.226002 Transcript_81593/m.226002 type:complete len:234 (+) Transcript_81593:134-835(+)